MATALVVIVGVVGPSLAGWPFGLSGGGSSRYTRTVVARLDASFAALNGCPAGRKADFRVLVFVDGRGHMLWKSVAKSSGRKDVDAAALRAVDRAAPFPAAPEGLPRGVLWHGACRGTGGGDGGGKGKRTGAKTIEARISAGPLG